MRRIANEFLVGTLVAAGLVASAVVAAALLAAASASAAPPWRAPTGIGPQTRGTYLVLTPAPQLAVDARGEAIAVWVRVGKHQGKSVELASRPPQGSWSAPRALVRRVPVVSAVRTAIDGGAAIVLWERRLHDVYVLEAITRSSGGAWSVPAVLAESAYPLGPVAAVDGAGEAIVLWQRLVETTKSVTTTKFVEGVMRPAGSGWSAPTVLAEEEMGPVYQAIELGVSFDLGVAADRSGGATAVWETPAPGDSGTAIESASRSPDGSWSRPTVISAAGADAEAPEVAMDAEGEAVALWANSRGDEPIESSSLRPGGTWSAPETIGRCPDAEISPGQVSIVDGGAIVTWLCFSQRDAIKSVSRGPGGTWSAPKVIDQGRVDLGMPVIAMNAAREAVAVWRKGPAANTVGPLRPGIWSSSWSPGSDWSAPAEVTRGPGLERPNVGIDAAGEATAIWDRYSALTTSTRPPPGS